MPIAGYRTGFYQTGCNEFKVSGREPLFNYSVNAIIFRFRFRFRFRFISQYVHIQGGYSHLHVMYRGGLLNRPIHVSCPYAHHAFIQLSHVRSPQHLSQHMIHNAHNTRTLPQRLDNMCRLSFRRKCLSPTGMRDLFSHVTPR